MATERCFCHLMMRVFVKSVSNIRDEVIENKLSDIRGEIGLTEEELKMHRDFLNVKTKEAAALKASDQVLGLVARR